MQINDDDDDVDDDDDDDDNDDITVSRVSTDTAVITRCVERRNFLTARRVLYLNNVVKRLLVCCARSPRMQ